MTLQRLLGTELPIIQALMAGGHRGLFQSADLSTQVGTAYLLCPEATPSAVHRAALASDTARHTALTNRFTGRPARAIVNCIMRELGPIGPAVPEFPLAVGAIAPLRAKAESQGCGDFSPLWFGQNASGCRQVPAAELTREWAATHQEAS